MSRNVDFVFSVLLATSFLVSAKAAGADEVRSRLAGCANLADDSERLACFDTLTSNLDELGDQQSTDASESKSGTEATPRVVPLDDTVGSGEQKTYVSRLTNCSEPAGSARQYYYLENGQVWRQSNSGRSQLRDCDAEIEIQRDMFGFKMSIPSQKRNIRVTRVR